MNRRPADKNDQTTEDSVVSRIVPVIVVFATVSGFMALAWYAYHTGSQSLNEEDLLVVEADKTPVKEKPTDPGGMQFPNQDKTIFETFAGGGQQPPKVERVLPTPEQPMAKKIDTSETKTWINEKLHKQNQQNNAAPAPADKPMAEQVIGGEEKKPDDVAAVQAAPAVEAQPAAEPKPVAAPVVQAEQPKPATPPAVDNTAAEKLAAEKKAAEEKLAAEKKLAEQKAAEEKLKAEKLAAEKKAAEDKAAADKKTTEEKLKAEKLAAEKKAAEDKLAAEKKQAEQKAAEEKLKAEKLAAEKKAAEEKAAKQKAGVQVIQAGAAAKDKPTGKTGAYKVQLGAYRSEKEAQDAWNKMKSAHKEFANMQPVIVKADLGEKGIYYRLRTGTFASTAEAKAFCGTMSILGQACILPTE